MPKPTARQLEAFKYVYFMELTYAEAGERMDISRQAVSKLLKKLARTSKVYAKLIKSTNPSTPPKIVSYEPTMDNVVIRIF